jgi:hypothetical protein
MSFIKIGNRIINTYHVTSVELHYEQPAFSPPDLDDPDRSEAEHPVLTADLVRVHFDGGQEAMVFYHSEAAALREYFTDPKNVISMAEKGKIGEIGFH